MEPNDLPAAVAEKVQQWLGVHSILHFWEHDETYYIVARAHNVSSEKDIYCLRLFPKGGQFFLSQDNVIYA